MLFEIKHRYNGSVLFSLECGSLRLCLQAAVESRANLYGADLSRANLDIKPATQEEAVANLDRVRAIILDNQELLDMGHWHADDSEWQKHTCAEEAVCGTTHCLAGWLQVCYTDEKIRNLAPELAGTLLAPCASHTFTWGDDRMLAWLKERDYAKVEA